MRIIKKMLYYCRIFCTRQNWRILRRSDVLLVANDVDRYVRWQGKAYSPILDSLGEELELRGIRCARLASPYSLMVGNEAFGCPASLNRKKLISAVLFRWRCRNGRWSMVRAYEQVIRKVCCKVVLAIDPAPELCLAAHRTGAVVWEMMHGMGYTNLNTIFRSSDRMEQPDRFLVLDSVTMSTLEAGVAQDQSVSTIDHPWLSRFQAPDLSWMDNFGWSVPQDLHQARETGKKIILVTLQWGYDGDCDEFNGILDNGIISEEIIEAIRGSEDRFFWILKLHPVQVTLPRYQRHREFVKILGGKHSNIVHGIDHLPLPLLLKFVDAHITMSSMACYEAAWMNIPSLVLCPTMRLNEKYQFYFNDLIQHGFVEKKEIKLEKIRQWMDLAERKQKPYLRVVDQMGGLTEDIWKIIMVQNFR